jgi:hypothetical protein
MGTCGASLGSVDILSVQGFRDVMSEVLLILLRMENVSYTLVVSACTWTIGWWAPS